MEALMEKYIPRPNRHFHFMNEECLINTPWKFPDRYYHDAAVEIEGELFYVDSKVANHIAQCYDVINSMEHACEINGIDWQAIIEAENV
jgi:hypothetical protein